MNKVLCVGELLVDFFTAEVNVSLSEAEVFVKKAGGAPANVCVAIVRLGGEARFCGKVGHDSFGRFLEETLIQYKIDTRYLMKSARPTTLAFVTRQQDGEREFEFQRGADGEVTIDDLAKFAFDEEIAHFGSATALLQAPFRDAYIDLMAKLQKGGTFISFDPNYRVDLWNGQAEAYFQAITKCVRFAHLVKMSEEEYTMFSAYLALEGLTFADVSTAVLAVTLGSRGTKLIVGNEERLVPSIAVDAVDSTGAGDAFVGGILYQLASANPPNVKEQLIERQNDKRALNSTFMAELVGLVDFANIVGAITCTQVGAMNALPTREKVLFRKKQ